MLGTCSLPWETMWSATAMNRGDGSKDATPDRGGMSRGSANQLTAAVLSARAVPDQLPSWGRGGAGSEPSLGFGASFPEDPSDLLEDPSEPAVGAGVGVGVGVG